MFLRKRLENLEAAMAPRGRHICIWGMTTGDGVTNRLKTDGEISRDIAAARSVGAIGPDDKVVVLRWQI